MLCVPGLGVALEMNLARQFSRASSGEAWVVVDAYFWDCAVGTTLSEQSY